MNTALILAGGIGTRLGADVPKQYIEVNNRPIIAYCMDTFFDSDSVDAVWIVADVSWQEYIHEQIEQQANKQKFYGFSEPGKNRQLSIWNGLNDMQEYAGEEIW